MTPQTAQTFAAQTAEALAAFTTVSIHDVAPNRRRGGDIRTVLSPATCGAKAGFMGTLTLLPGEVVTEHWHPYSEEFIYCVRGGITIRLNGIEQPLRAESGVHVPIGVRHRLMNTGDDEAFFVFTLGPLAPRPDLGHVDTEEISAAQAAAAHPHVGTA